MNFTLKFATSKTAKDVQAARAIELAKLDLQNPLLAQNPVALWHVTRRYHEAMGDTEFETVVPKPPEADLPVSPEVELQRLINGERIFVHPMDNHAWHIQKHTEQMNRLAQSSTPDERMLTELAAHVAEHTSKERMAQMANALAMEAVQAGIGAPGAAPVGAPA